MGMTMLVSQSVTSEVAWEGVVRISVLIKKESGNPMAENGGAKVCHGGGGMGLLRAV